VKRTRNFISIGLLAALCAACTPSSPVGLLDVGRIAANWPKYQSFQNQLQADEQGIAASKASNKLKAREAAALQAKYGHITAQLTQEIKDAASKVAQQRNLKLVVTREGVGYGGVDITPDVEKAMNITETATPTP
jgi:Skp family chaperone for outer membrane proteins